MRTSCGCTTPRIENALLKPYQKGAVLAHLNSDSYLGRRQATVTVTFDRPSYAEVQLQVAAYVHQEVLFDHDSIDLGNVNQGAGAAGKIVVYRAGRSDWTVSEAKPSSPYLSGKVVERARQENQVWYEVEVRLAKNAPSGSFQDHILLTTNDSAAPQIPVTVAGQVIAKVNVSPATLFLGAMHPGEKSNPAGRGLEQQPFSITSVAGNPASFQFPAKVQAAKTVHVLPVTFIAGADHGPVVKTVHITTDCDGATADVSTCAIITK